MSTQLPADITAAIDRLMQASRSEGYAMAIGVGEKEAQAERNANSARFALETLLVQRVVPTDLGRAALAEEGRAE